MLSGLSRVPAITAVGFLLLVQTASADYRIPGGNDSGTGQVNDSLFAYDLMSGSPGVDSGASSSEMYFDMTGADPFPTADPSIPVEEELVVGSGTNAIAVVDPILTAPRAVPEPATVALIGIALIGFGIRLRRGA
jgi:hypothetical protein